MSLYIDTSCLWKLLFPEPESERTRTIIDTEPSVLLSYLTIMEVEQQLRASRLGRRLTPSDFRHLSAALAGLCSTPPFVIKATSHDLTQIARRHATTGPYCRTADRLHLAAMEALGAKRLFTNDDTQAAAARALGYGVVLPR